MTTLMAHLEVGSSNAKLLQVVGELATRLEADVIGFAACQPMRIADGDNYVSDDIIELDRAQLKEEITAAEVEFNTALQERARSIEWRSIITFAPLAGALAHQARCADLVVTAVDHKRSLFDSSYHVDIGDLVMQAGRPVLIVPASVEKAAIKRVLIGWKDTRESRRAVFDALPLLRRAERVVVCEIAAEAGLEDARRHLADVAAWLKRDGIMAEAMPALEMDDDAARLKEIADKERADVIVAGAYGHSRLREWAFGGVTRELLLHSTRCCLVSH